LFEPVASAARLSLPDWGRYPYFAEILACATTNGEKRVPAPISKAPGHQWSMQRFEKISGMGGLK
jgi:hypothetical protein